MALHGVSQGKLARRAGVRVDHVGRILNGHVKRPALETMLVLDEALERILEERKQP